MVKIGMLLAVCLLTAACGTDPVEQWLTRAEECMEVNADSARRCLQYIEGTDACSDEQRARYALLRTQAMHKCRIPLESDSLINVAVAYYTDSDDRHRLALSLLYKGLVHKQNHQVEQAVEAFVASEQAFEGVEDDQYKALLFNHHAAVLISQEMYGKALVYCKESYKYQLLGDSLHYVVTMCGQIARMYKMLNQPDSAKAYYERGLSYKDSLSDGKKRNYYLLLQSYATFLMGNDNYAEAERLLQECLTNMKDSNYYYTLYSALTTLYYEKREYKTALTYGQQILASDDSLTVCGGYLRLYKIYKDMGRMDSALHYHNLYRQYHSDISLRRRTAEVAVIPHKMKVGQLSEKNRALMGWRMWLVVGLLAITTVWWGIYRTIRCRHRREQGAKEQELAVKEQELAAKEGELESVGNKYGKTSAELGRLKGALTNHVAAMDRLKKDHQTILDEHKKEIEELKKSVKELKGEIDDLKKADRATQRTENDLKRTLHHLEKELEKRTGQLNEAEHQHEIDRRIVHFMAGGECKKAVDMLLGLRLKRKVDVRYDIGREEYHYLMMQLLEQENPALYARLEQCELDKTKRTLCCMIALGLDDIDMMAEAVCLSPYTVKTYRKECRELLDSFSCKNHKLL